MQIKRNRRFARSQRLRADHIKAMQERARLRGLELVLPLTPKGNNK